ncbi:MAG: hypothetical protein IT159_05535 [Bryobacterales bacterium]|nr:hypothetical protein [Bryobacterales bacterium]
MKCAKCEARRARRFCPALRDEICAVCCGESREVTLDCPFDCPYLEEARRHDRTLAIDPESLPNRDIEVSETFMEDNAVLFNVLGGAIAGIGSATPGATDHDIREALDAMIRTCRTRDSGLIYETRPTNLIAAGIQRRLSEEIDEARRQLRERQGLSTVRDADVLGVLVMFQRIELSYNNGRPRSRAFLDFLRRGFREDRPLNPAV